MPYFYKQKRQSALYAKAELLSMRPDRMRFKAHWWGAKLMEPITEFIPVIVDCKLTDCALTNEEAEYLELLGRPWAG